MGKTVFINFEGNFNKGFQITLEIAVDGKQPFIKFKGYLPSNTKVKDNYENWESSYQNLKVRTRKIQFKSDEDTSFAETQKCREFAQILSKELSAWLNSDEFRPIKEKLLQELKTSEPVRVIFQTDDSQMKQLPWHLWSFFKDYSKAEVALSSSLFTAPQQKLPPRNKLRILAILGNSEEIDIEKDRQLLENIPDAEIVILIEPKRPELEDKLVDKRGWDILFFAGHGSSSQADGHTGQIYINQKDSLTIQELRWPLKTAIENGLKLAIFNSCEGLGLTSELGDLKMPQVIVMKQPVPDLVAQQFLKFFIEAFSSGEPLYFAVRIARERLNPLEKELPCATWLPVIYQNPAEVPPTWEELKPPESGSLTQRLGDTISPIVSQAERLKQELEKNTEDEKRIKLPSVIELNSIGDFWEKNFIEGQFISIEAALSQYAPMLVGPPMLKREVHRGYRRAIPEYDFEEMREMKTVIDANLAFTAGQMVLRLNPQKTDWIYMGLYHSIVRNSIPVFVEKDYYNRVVEPLFGTEENRITYVIDAKVIGRLISFPRDFLREFIEKYHLQSLIRPDILGPEDGKKVFAMFIDGNNTKIEYTGAARYLDGDIWVALKFQDEEKFVSRFIDFSNLEDVRRESKALEKDIQEFLPDGNIIYQFDQVEKIIPGYQTVDKMLEGFIKPKNTSSPPSSS